MGRTGVMKFGVAAGVAAAFFCFTATAFAATIYANSSTGSDTTGNGTSGSPYQTFTKAYSAASSGDTINLTGTFDWSNASETTSVTTGFTINKSIIITGQSAASTIIQASSTPGTANRRVFTLGTSGISVTFEDLTIQYGDIANNGAGVSNGGSNSSNTVLFQDCILNQNYATNGSGGAYYDYYTGGSSNSFTMNDCTVENNSAESGSNNEFGGGLQLAQGQNVITNSTFTGNSAKTDGAGISQYYGSLTITDTTFAGNSQSAALNDAYNSGSDAIILTNDTIAYNTASSSVYAGGIDTQSGSAPYYLENDLLFGNTNTSGSADWYDGGATASGSYNIIGSQVGGTNFTNGSNHNIVGTGTTVNLSSTLASNSTTRLTQTLALSAGSAAIDAGTFTANDGVSVPYADQRGLYRNGNPDIGAYEYNALSYVATPSVSSTNVTFASVTQSSMTASWTNGNGADRVVFIAATTSPYTAASSTNDTTYTASGTFGSGTEIGTTGWYAVYKGTGTSVSISGLTSNSAYAVQVVDFNGDPGSEQYLSATSTGNPAATSTIPYSTPTTPAKNVSFGSISGGSATISWTNGNGADRIVFIAATTSLSTAPAANGTSYSPSTVFGSGTQIGSTGWYTVANGTGSSVTVSGLTYNQAYAVDVVEYNGTSGYQQYLTTATTTNPYSRSAYNGTTIYSNSSTGSDSTGTGTSGNPYATFTKAYSAAADGDTINLTGTFNWANAGETGDSAPAGFTLGKSITITGQGASSTVIEASSTEASATERLFYISTNVSITFQNLQMRYGNPGSNSGGCLYATTGSFTFSYVDINSCRSTANGGGLYLGNAGTTTIENSSLHNLITGADYGAIDQTGAANLFIINSTLSGNYATTTSESGAAYGGNNGHAWFVNDTITGNYSYEGALEDDGTTAYVRNTIVAGNFATSSANADLRRTVGAITSEGNNIFGTFVPSSSISTTTSDWTNTSGNGTFIMYATSTTGTLSLGALALDNGSGTYVAPLLAGSIGIDQGSSAAFTANSVAVTPPTVDQRGLERDSLPDIGAYEYSGGTNPPVISGIASSTGATTATITWTTNESATSTVNYGLSNSYGSASSSSSFATTHSIMLTGLSSGTTYHFQVASGDAYYNVATSSDYTFMTSVVDTTPPTVSLAAPVANEATSSTMTLAANASDNVAVAGVKFYIDGVQIGGEDTTSPYATTFDTTATSSGTYTAFAVARDTSNNYATSSSVSFTINNAGPVIYSIAAATTSSGATIGWKSDLPASSEIAFGLFSSYSTSTSVSGTGTSHSVTLVGLPPCAVYHYAVVSTDGSSHTSTSSDATFDTGGCTGDASILSTGENAVPALSGGSLTQGDLALSVPVSFTATSSSATFQANQLDGTAFFNTAGTPAGMSTVGTDVFDLKAFTDATTTLSTFASPLTVTLTYVPADVSGLSLSSLTIYRYDSGAWTALSGCSVNTTEDTVSCQTSNFSDFALFGQESSGGSGSGNDQIAANGPPLSGPLSIGYVAQNPGAMATDTTTDAIAYQFTRSLKRGMSGNDVLHLQQFLNAHDAPLASSGLGSSGNETPYFGALTFNALVEYQTANASAILAPLHLSHGTGYFGPSTVSFVNKVLAAGQ